MSLRPAVNVPDLLERDAPVRRIRAIREECEQSKLDIAHWNRMHPDEEPISSAWEDEMIAWCDRGGEGPLPGRVRPSPEEPA